METDSTDNIPEATKCAPGSIRAISKDTVHKICSGQVVLSLAIAVKELVENAVDAGANLVEVKLRDQGLESVEVSDNGSGVEEANLEAMTAKYHTSKIQEFEDLLGVETFGFRGEALSSLCSLANMAIITRHKNASAAIKIELDHNGKITNRAPCSRTIGTTVILTQLFTTLPVRRRDFMRNIKREFNKMCHLLQGYCLVSQGVRIICSNHTEKNGKTVVMQTNGAKEILANISAIFGPKQSTDLIKIKPAFDTEDTLTKETLQDDLDISQSIDSTQITNEDVESLKNEKFKIDGYISSCSHGAGRSSKDRQFFFVNSRPCDPTSIARVVNEIYHRYNAQQHPFIYLNIITPRADVDVNLTPDKRQLLIHNEKLLLLFIKKALLNTFGSIPSQYKMHNTSIATIFKAEPKVEPKIEIMECSQEESVLSVINDKEDDIKSERIISDSMENDKNNSKNIADINEEELVPISSSQKFMDVLSQWRRTGNTVGPAEPCRVNKRKGTNEIEARTLKLQKIQEYLTREAPTIQEMNPLYSYKSDPESDTEESNVDNDNNCLSESISNIEKLNKASKEYDEIISAPTIDCKVGGPAKFFLKFLNNKDKKHVSKEPTCDVKTIKNVEASTNCADETITIEQIDCKVIKPVKSFLPLRTYKLETTEVDDYSLPSTQDSQLTTTSNTTEDEIELPNTQISNDSDFEEMPSTSVAAAKKIIELDDNQESESESLSGEFSDMTINITIDEIEANLKAENALKTKTSSTLKRLRFKSQIDPNQNKNAESELQTELSKPDFARMQVLGQFNLGFIIVKLDDDLFIVDQHATDEKYNFETLQQTTTLQSQPLAVPQQLEMTVVNEMVLMDHLAVFEKNGFKFEIDENAPAGRKVRLLCKPFSQNWEFGKEDIDELIFMLQDAPEGTICRPSRIRAMFASRACRKSVMIGTALSETTMQTLIKHMGEIDQPWNCPHGRPTLRHLVNLTMLKPVESEDDITEKDDETVTSSS